MTSLEDPLNIVPSFDDKRLVGQHSQNLSWDTFNLSKGRRLIAKDKLNDKVKTVDLSKNFSVHFERHPDGTIPPWVKALMRVAKNSDHGTLFQEQVHSDLNLVISGLSKETQKQLNHAQSMTYADLVKGSLNRMAQLEGGHGPFSEFLKVAKFEDVMMRTYATDGSGSLPNWSAHAERIDRVNMAGKMVPGQLIHHPNGEVGLGLHGALMGPAVLDFDGDQARLLMVSIGAQQYGIATKDPGHFTLPAIKFHNPLYPFSALQQDAGIINRYAQGVSRTPRGLFESSVFQNNQLKDQLKVMEERRSALMDLARSPNSAKRLKANEALMKTEMKDVMTKLEGAKGVGQTHNKMIQYEWNKIAEQIRANPNIDDGLKRQILMHGTAEGDFRTQIVELLIKSTRKGTEAVFDDDWMSFNKVFTNSVNMFLHGLEGQQLGNMDPIFFTRELVGMVADSNGNLGEDFMHTLGHMAANASLISLQGESVVKKSYNAKLRPTSVNPLFGEQKSDTYGLLKDLGYIREQFVEVGNMDPSLEALGPRMVLNLDPSLGRGFDNAPLHSPMGMITNEGKFQQNMIWHPSIVKGQEDRVFKATEVARKVVNNTFDPTWQHQAHGKTFTESLGSYSSKSAYSAEMLQNKQWSDQVAFDFVESKMDVNFTHLSTSHSKSERIETMASIIRAFGGKMSGEGDELSVESKQFILTAQSVSRGGSQKLKELSATMALGDFGSHATVQHLSNGNVRMINSAVEPLLMSTATLSIPEGYNKIDPLAESAYSLRTEGVNVGGHRLYGTKYLREANSENNTTRVTLGNQFGSFLKGGNLGASDQRSGKLLSQASESLEIRGLTSVWINTDPTTELAKELGVSPEELNNIFRKSRGEIAGTEAKSLLVENWGEGSAYYTTSFMEKAKKQAAKGHITENAPAWMTNEVELRKEGYTPKSVNIHGKSSVKWTRKVEHERFNRVIDITGETRIEASHINRVYYGTEGKEADIMRNIGELNAKSDFKDEAALYSYYSRKNDPNAVKGRLDQHASDIDDLVKQFHLSPKQEKDLIDFASKKERLAESLLSEVGVRAYHDITPVDKNTLTMTKGWVHEADSILSVQNSSEIRAKLAANPRDFNSSTRDSVLKSLATDIRAVMQDLGFDPGDEAELFNNVAGFYEDHVASNPGVKENIELLHLLSTFQGMLTKGETSKAVFSANMAGRLKVNSENTGTMIGMAIGKHIEDLYNPQMLKVALPIAVTAGAVGVGLNYMHRKNRQRERLG